MRVVVDTNVIVSFLLRPRSIPGRAFLEIGARHTFLVSQATIGEMIDVLAYPKIERLVTKRLREAVLRRIARIAEFVEPSESIVVCRDPRDDKFLELAVAGSADCIVSGDQDLIAFGSFLGSAILTPAQFMERHVHQAR